MLLGVLRGPLAGDLFRMLILYRYGGIYVDVDVILLRSLELLIVKYLYYL
jgi:mannosyltransferase OCH1-like enzyme